MAAVMTPESAVASKPLSLQEIRAKIQRAIERKYYRRSEDVKEEIEKIKEELSMSKRREQSCVEQTSQYMTEKADYESALKEAIEYKTYLAAGGDDPDKIVNDLNTKIQELHSKIEGQRESLNQVQIEIADKGRKIAALELELDKIEAAKKADALRKPEERNEYVSPSTAKSIFYFRQTYQRILSQLPSFKQEVQDLFREVELLPKKLDCFSHDPNARALFVMVLGAKVKMQMIERCHEMNADEIEATRQMLNAVRTMAKTYNAGVIEALGGGDRPRHYMSWREYYNDANAQCQNYFDPKKTDDKRDFDKQRFGVMIPAPMATVPPTEPVAIKRILPVAPIVKTAPAVPAAIQTLNHIVKELAKKEEEPEIKESLDKRIVRIVGESGVRKKTKDLRVSILAGQADKNKPLIKLLEDAFEFGKVRWYDNNCGHLVDSIKIGGVHLVIAIPEWHEGYAQYVRLAKDKGVGTMVLTGTNKKLIVQQICAHFGTQVKIDE